MLNMSARTQDNALLSGILLIDKPQDFTSHDVVAKMRGILRTRKIGHAGTLDPMATGVLPLFLGTATKACDMMPDQSKRYTASFRLGIVTDTQDITGTVLEQRPVTVGRSDVEQALAQFRGEIDQLPPMYSAVQVGGRRLYDLAREGKVVERTPRRITIYSLELIDGEGEDYTVDIHCSKGSYVRTICHDLGEALGCGAALTALRRTMAGGYSIENCITIDQAQREMEENTLGRRILPVESVFTSLPRLEMTAKQAGHFCNGVRMSLGQFGGQQPQALVAVYSPDGFIGVADTDTDQKLLIQKKLFQ